MQVNEFAFDYQGQPIIVEEILFGQARYLYIGSLKRQFEDLSLSYPSPPASTHMIGDNPTDELGLYFSSYFKAPVLISYNFPLETEDDQNRFDFVKLSLCKHYAAKRKE
ncbi:hypothetical protein M9Y10_005113 [Tritrichomonas musculus]|uniref:Uncharacterized protein n=1 Tax=Tritrichomonas musculus TaxID=1915356 RepID=A0ABR2JKD3_9EUKA